MISLNNVAAPQDVQTLADLVALLADPKASAARISEFQKAANELRAATEAMATRQREFVSDEARHQEKLAAALAAHEKAIAAAQKKFDAERLRQENSLAAQAERLTALEEKATAAAAANDELRADLQRRLEHLRAASAA